MKLFVMVLGIYFDIFAQSPDFFRERIEVDIHDKSCDLRGTYYFKNTSQQDIAHSLYYPFVINDQLGFPDSICVTNRVDGHKLKCITSEQGVSFALKIPKHSIVVIDVYYNQKTPENIFEYILLTTKNWHKPLDLAEYQITISENLKIMQISYPFKKAPSEGGRSVYTLEKKYFGPDKNLTIQWDG